MIFTTQKERGIYSAFQGKLVGTKLLKTSVCKTVALFPPDIIDVVTKTCWFVGSMDDAFAYTLTGNDLKNQHLIFLSDELFFEGESQIRFSIAHEIGHVVLGHRNSVFVQQEKAEIRIQEKEADEFARHYG